MVQINGYYHTMFMRFREVTSGKNKLERWLLQSSLLSLNIKEGCNKPVAYVAVAKCHFKDLKSAFWSSPCWFLEPRVTIFGHECIVLGYY